MISRTTVFLMTFCLTLSAMAQLSIEAEYRPRFEARAGYGRLKPDSLSPEYLISQRTRLGVRFKRQDLQTFISFQDVRYWGGDNLYKPHGIFGYNANVDLNEAWLKVIFLNHSSIKIGRQLFNYDDYRLLSARNWNDRGIFYDAFLYQFSQNQLDVDLALSYYNDNDKVNLFDNYFPPDKLKTINFLRIHKIFNEHLKASVIALASGYTKNKSSETIYIKGSYGTYLHFKDNSKVIWLSAYAQNGRSQDGRKAQAWNLNGEATFTLGKMNFGPGFSLISGQSSDSTIDTRFDLLYGVRHATYGHMDYFNNLPVATGNGGLNDLYLMWRWKLLPKLELFADYHYFALNKDVKDYDRYLGSEIDLYMIYRIKPDMTLQTGYSVMLPGATMEKIQRYKPGKSDFSHWFYLMFTVKPTLFTAKEP